MELFKGKEDRSIALNMVNDFFDRDQPNLTQLNAMEEKIKALSGEFEKPKRREPLTPARTDVYGRLD
jgi:hypothetical protein